EHAHPADRDRGEILGAEASREPGVTCLDARAGALDHHGFRKARELQDRRSLDGGACADEDVLLVIGRKPLQLDVEHVEARRQNGEAQLPFFVGGLTCRTAAVERRRTTAPGRTPPCASITVPTSAPVNPCAGTVRGSRMLATVTRSDTLRRMRLVDGRRRL